MQARYARWLWTSVFAATFLVFHERSYAGPLPAPCVVDAQCLPDPTDPPCVHRFCDLLDKTCKPAPDPAGTECRASAGLCDPAEACDGTSLGCPPDAVAPAGTLCRPDAGACDVAEFCTGTSPGCPSNGFDPLGTPCTSDGFECTNDVCNASGLCTHPNKLDGTTCGSAGNTDCTNPDICQGGVCQPNHEPAGTVCRPSAGVCDPAENCTGASPNCPADALRPAGYPCSSGTSETGACEAPDICTGSSAACPDALDPAGTVCRPSADVCDPAEQCTGSSPTCPPNVTNPGCCFSDADCPLDPNKCINSFCDLTDNTCKQEQIAECRVSISKKGSLLYYSKIELRWTVTAGPPVVVTPRQDTFITIVNDFPEEVIVQWYFINGDEPLAAVFAGDPVALVERAHPGWNSVDCTTRLTEDETTYYSAFTGGPLGCQPFTILDPGALPGRPDPENVGQRVLRGYAIAFAVDNDGSEISWNHLTGHTTIVNYADRSAWEYNTYAFECVADPDAGDPCRREIGDVAGQNNSGALYMDGTQYDYVFDKLLFDFYAVGSLAFSLVPGTTVMLDTDLTLYPVSVDLRTDDTDSDGPVMTRAKFDVWNQNEDAQSGVNRCITCWDQTLLSNYDAPNSFLIGNIQTNKGKARIDGIESDSCDALGACCCSSEDLNNDNCDDPDCNEVDFARGNPDRDCSQDAALLGVSDKVLAFSGAGIPVGARTDAGMTLVGQGTEEAVIKRDLVEGPDPLTAPPLMGRNESVRQNGELSGVRIRGKR